MFGGCFALLRIAAGLAATDAGGLAAGALLIGLIWLVGTPALLSGVASVGGAFTATQAAIALLTLSLALLLDGSPGAGIALLGVVFDAQPEVALWGVFALAGASVALVRQGAPAARSWLAGGACALLLAAPAALWWAHTGTAGLLPTGAAMGPLLPPPRWLPWTVPLANWVLGACMLATGLAAFSVLGPDARAGHGAFLGLLLVFVCGCVATLLTANPWVLALRPIAADSVLQLFAAAAATAVVVRDLRGGTSVLRVALSVAIAASLLLHPYLLPVAALAMLARAAAAHGELLGIRAPHPRLEPRVAAARGTGRGRSGSTGGMRTARRMAAALKPLVAGARPWGSSRRPFSGRPPAGDQLAWSSRAVNSQWRPW